MKSNHIIHISISAVFSTPDTSFNFLVCKQLINHLSNSLASSGYKLIIWHKTLNSWTCKATIVVRFSRLHLIAHIVLIYIVRIGAASYLILMEPPHIMVWISRLMPLGSPTIEWRVTLSIKWSPRQQVGHGHHAAYFIIYIYIHFMSWALSLLFVI